MFLLHPSVITFMIFLSEDFVLKESYLKNESTNSNLLNTCRSSTPSPTPI